MNYLQWFIFFIIFCLPGNQAVANPKDHLTFNLNIIEKGGEAEGGIKKETKTYDYGDKGPGADPRIMDLGGGRGVLSKSGGVDPGAGPGVLDPGAGWKVVPGEGPIVVNAHNVLMVSPGAVGPGGSLVSLPVGPSPVDPDADSDCKYHNYKNWYELISPCFKQQVGMGRPDGHCLPSPNGKLLSKIYKAVDKLERKVENNRKLKQLSELMEKAAMHESFGQWCPGSFYDMNQYLKVVLTKAPQYLPGAPYYIGVPITTVLLCYLHTQEGRYFFSHPIVNDCMLNIVNNYANFLISYESVLVLNSGQFGWKSKCALKELNYMNDFVYDKRDKYWGYTSWNDFFTRKLRKGARPIYQKDNNRIINAFGDNKFVHTEMNLQPRTKLWIKNESYSLFEIFNRNTDFVDLFIGGTAMHVFFSATKYHHYHAPVSGKVIYAENIKGILYAIDEVNVMTDKKKLNDLQGWIKSGKNGLIETQVYLAHVSTRSIVIIENDLLGPVASIFIGMSEISSCKLDPILKGYKKGKPHYVEKGDHLGLFQYGGSSGLIVLNNGIVKMKKEPFWDMHLLSDNIKMGAPIVML